ncbi:TPA: hypothetical protein ACNIFK_004441 [Escherichia coli]|nr:hypothetical protein [Escherichia coli]MCD6764052.1 hypothetical protein [Escherichia coli]MCG4322524.1 hypothetical protein [Escherichia coli]MCG5232850.1 hypothetical protein [Escherichia coli]MCI4995862.1 hypothetical protein [Escherichia coli]MCM2808472.1 hypothetical protein [Escherichia coli]
MGWSLCFWHVSVRMTHDVVGLLLLTSSLP